MGRGRAEHERECNHFACVLKNVPGYPLCSKIRAMFNSIASGKNARAIATMPITSLFVLMYICRCN